MADFIAKFETDQSLVQAIFDSDADLEADFGEVQTVGIGGDLYEGSYEVTPKVESQTMPTKGKLLVKDMKIKEVPVFRVSNSSGGTTVYIASEV